MDKQTEGKSERERKTKRLYIKGTSKEMKRLKKKKKRNEPHE